jgi:hypothetical protein
MQIAETANHQFTRCPTACSLLASPTSIAGITRFLRARSQIDTLWCASLAVTSRRQKKSRLRRLFCSFSILSLRD